MISNVLAHRPDNDAIMSVKSNLLKVLICYFRDLVPVVDGIDIRVLKPDYIGFGDLMSYRYDDIRVPCVIPSKTE